MCKRETECKLVEVLRKMLYVPYVENNSDLVIDDVAASFVNEAITIVKSLLPESEIKRAIAEERTFH